MGISLNGFCLRWCIWMMKLIYLFLSHFALRNKLGSTWRVIKLPQGLFRIHLMLVV